MFCEGNLIKFKDRVAINDRYGVVIESFKIAGENYYHIYSEGKLVVANEAIIEKFIF